MYKKLRKKAEKKVEAKMAFYTFAIIFSFISMILLIISFQLPAIRVWLMLPIPILLMVLAILYLDAFGYSTKGRLSEDWKEEEIEKEMLKLYQQRSASSIALSEEELSENDILELKELERLQEKWGYRNEDYV